MKSTSAEVRNNHYRGAGEFTDPWESFRETQQGYDLYSSDPRWAGRFTLVSLERVSDGHRLTRSGYIDRLTGAFRFTGASRGG